MCNIAKIFFVNRRITITFLFTFFFFVASSQQRFSIATDLSLQRSFKKDQTYWALGQTVQSIFHLSPRNGIYVWFAYYSQGRFTSKMSATAKSPLTNPQEIHYIDSTRIQLRQFSVGWRKYLKGTPDIEEGWNLYCYAGLGLVPGQVQNAHSVPIDTFTYHVPVHAGKAGFKRLTLDLGVGVEVPLGAEFYFYTDGRVWVPTTDYPSKYLLVNNNAPLVGMLSIGVRVIF